MFSYIFLLFIHFSCFPFFLYLRFYFSIIFSILSSSSSLTSSFSSSFSLSSFSYISRYCCCLIFLLPLCIILLFLNISSSFVTPSPPFLFLDSPVPSSPFISLVNSTHRHFLPIHLSISFPFLFFNIFLFIYVSIFLFPFLYVHVLFFFFFL